MHCYVLVPYPNHFTYFVFITITTDLQCLIMQYMTVYQHVRFYIVSARNEDQKLVGHFLKIG